MTTDLFLAAILLSLLGAILSLVVTDRAARLLLGFLGAPSALLLTVAAALALRSREPLAIPLWRLLGQDRMVLVIDGLSAFFLLVTGLVALPVAIFSTAYLKRYVGRYSLRLLAFCQHLLLASIAILLAAGDIVSFLIGWEAMSILCYLLVCFEHEKNESRSAGFLMLAMSEAGTLAAAVAFLLLASPSGGLDYASLREAGQHLSPWFRIAVFLLSFVGFSVKAGLVPLSSWLPRAHPVAPANVSALLSGVILNLGIYGILRVNMDLLPADRPFEGMIVVLVGVISALIGILYATVATDLKVMLAHSSIENMGIVTAGFGAFLVFRATSHPGLAGMAIVASGYHLINHSVSKALLFLGAGSIDARVGERDMDRLGGLIRLMPGTALLFLVGTLAIGALPPLNGFVSEWLTLQTFLQTSALSSTGLRLAFALCGAALALTAGLAITCFVKAYAMTFLGVSRSKAAAHASPAGKAIGSSMALLALSCILLGVGPTYMIPLLHHSLMPKTSAVAGNAALATPASGRPPRATDILVPPFFAPEEGPLPEAFVAEFHAIGAQVGKGILPPPGLVVMHRGGKENPVVFAMSTAYAGVVFLLILGGIYLLSRLLGRRRRVSRRAPFAGGLRLTPDMTYTATGFSNPVRVIFDGIFRPTANETRAEVVANHFRTAIAHHRTETHIADRFVLGPALRLLKRLAAIAARMHNGHLNVYAAYVLVALLLALAAALAW